MSIKVLENNVVALMAAGEVIHRPADVIKELVENALDAQSTSIKVDLMQGGLEKICVTDNGCGISKEELKLALTPHATSKLSQIDDLQKMNTYGFRGEALYSISQVCNFTLSSRTHDMETGHSLAFRGPEREPKDSAKAMSLGTSIQADQLFAPYPVRRKFLKSPRIEFRHSSAPIFALALIHYKIEFSLFHNMRQEWRFLAASSPIERLENAFKGTKQTWSAKKRVFDKGTINIYYSSKANKGLEQWWFFNKRLVIDPSLKKLLSQYKNYGKVIFDIEVQSQYVDPNLHPQKLVVGLSFYEGFVATVHDFFQEVFGDQHIVKEVSQELLAHKSTTGQAKISDNYDLVTQLDQRDRIYSQSKNIHQDTFKEQSKSDIEVKPEEALAPFKILKNEEKTKGIDYLIVSPRSVAYILNKKLVIIKSNQLILRWLKLNLATKPLLIPFAIEQQAIRNELLNLGCRFFGNKITHIHPFIDCVSLERYLRRCKEISVADIYWSEFIKSDFFAMWSEKHLQDFINQESIIYEVVKTPVFSSLQEESVCATEKL